jgi:glycine oxidase
VVAVSFIPTLLRLCLRSFALYDRFVERVCHDSDRRVDYVRRGTLQIATDARGVAHLETEARRLSDTGVPHTLLTGSAIRELEPALAATSHAALLVPEHGYVAVPALVDALADAATRQGARFITDRATGVHGDERGAQVTTTEGTIEGDAVVIAAGSWSSEVAAIPDWPPPVKPIRGQLLHLRSDRPPLSHVVWGPDCYLVPWSDGSVLVGATVEDAGFDESPTVSGVRGLLNAATSLVPALADTRFEEVRVGLRPMTADELPIVGRSSTMRHVFYATGHYRNGILLAPLTASLVADLLLEARTSPELEIMRPSRFGL